MAPAQAIVMTPSMMYSQRQPDRPAVPSMKRIPSAMSPPTALDNADPTANNNQYNGSDFGNEHFILKRYEIRRPSSSRLYQFARNNVMDLTCR